MKNLLLFTSFLISCMVTGQNLLQEDVDNWPPGQDNPIAGFYSVPSTEQNIRLFEPGPFGESVLTWKATPDDDGDEHGGGLASNYHNIDFTQKYRFTIWLKKTGTNEGLSYLGAWGPSHVLEIFNSTVHENPLFLAAELPQLNTWYLAVGFIQNYEYSSTESEGRLYDQQGNEVGILRDFKWATWSTRVRLRAFSYFDTNPNNNLFLYAPRMEPINGLEPSIEELLDVGGTPTSLAFNYDQAGNQILRKVPSDNAGRGVTNPKSDLQQLFDETIELPLLETAGEEIVKDESIISTFSVTPNPVSDIMTVSWNSEYNGKVSTIMVSDFAGKAIQSENYKNGNLSTINLSSFPPGTYFVKITLEDTRVIVKKIIKN